MRVVRKKNIKKDHNNLDEDLKIEQRRMAYYKKENL